MIAAYAVINVYAFSARVFGPVPVGMNANAAGAAGYV